LQRIHPQHDLFRAARALASGDRVADKDDALVQAGRSGKHCLQVGFVRADQRDSLAGDFKGQPLRIANPGKVGVFGHDLIQHEVRVHLIFESQQPLHRSVHPFGKSAVFAIFLLERSQRARQRIEFIFRRVSHKTVDVQQVVAGHKCITRHLARVVNLPGGFIKTAQRRTAQVIAHQNAAAFPPPGKLGQLQHLVQGGRVKTHRAGGGANIALQALVADMRDQQAVGHRLRFHLAAGDGEKRRQFNLLQLLQ